MVKMGGKIFAWKNPPQQKNSGQAS